MHDSRFVPASFLLRFCFVSASFRLAARLPVQPRRSPCDYFQRPLRVYVTARYDGKMQSHLTFFVVLGVLFMISAWLTWRDPRRLKCAIWWGLTANLVVGGIAVMVLGWVTALPENLAPRILLVLLTGVALSLLVLAALLIGAGSVLIVRESFSLSHSLALALGVAVVLYLAAYPAVIWLDQERLTALLLLLGFPLGYLAFVLTSYLVYSGAYGYWARRWAPEPQVVVVLGSGLAGEELTPLLRRRADLGIEIFQKAEAAGKHPIMVASGGQGPGEMVPEGVAIARYFRAAGISPVAEETESTSTEENLQFSRELVADRSPWMAATSDYHAFRAATLMRELGIVGNAAGARTPKYFWSAAVLREFVALLRRHWLVNTIIVTVLTLPIIILIIGITVNS